MIKILIFTIISLALWLVLMEFVVAANKITLGARVEKSLVVNNRPHNGLQDAQPVQNTEGLDVLQYCAKDGLEWQVSCDLVVQ